MMIGAKDLAFPRINLLSWYIYIVGALFALAAIVMGGVDTGWTFYTPFSTTYSNTFVITAAVGVFIAGFSSILTGLNFIVTVHKMRAPGMTWGRLPLFVWANYATALIQVLGTPVVAITLALVGLERAFHIGIFDPAIGGDPILFQHMFWFYSHPAVYIMILPGMGVISELVTCFSRKGIFGYSFIAGSSLGIAIIGFLVWGHHMFVTGMSMYAGLYFSLLTMLVAVPSAIKVFNWTATMFRGSISYETPMLYAFGFIGLFTIGGLTGLFLGTLGVDVHLTDTYFVVAHFHYVMVGGMVVAYMGGLHFWWPKITGRMYPEGWGKFSALLVFVGFNLTFFPQFILGYLGPAAPLSRLCAGVPGAERDVDRRRFRAGRRVPDSADLFLVVAEVRQTGGQQSVGRQGPGMDHPIAAPDVQFRRDSDRHRRSLRLRKTRGGARWLIRTP